MASRVARLAKAYKESTPDINTGGILKRVQLESALAEEKANLSVQRFGVGADLLQSTGEFYNELKTDKRLATRAGKKFGILDFLTGDKEARAAADLGAALEKDNLIIQDGVQVEAPSIYEEDALAMNKGVKEFREMTELGTEKALGRKMTEEEKKEGLTNQQMGAQYSDEKIQSMGLEKKSAFTNLLQMFRGGK